MKNMKGKRIGFAITGSFCTLEAALNIITALTKADAEVYPILSESVNTTDTVYGTAASLKEKLTAITGNPIIKSISEAEPIGPKKLFDALVVLPATGNTIAKIALGITDSTVTMAAKAHMRNSRPVIIAVSSNDALAGSAKNIGQLLGMRNIYFVPFGQDMPYVKPRSMVFEPGLAVEAIAEALDGRQLQPILV